MGIKIYGLQLGSFPLPMAALFDPASGREPERFAGDIVQGMYQCPALSYVIDHPDAGLMLFETGVAANWSAEWLPEWLQLLSLDSVTPDVCLEAVLQQRGARAGGFLARDSGSPARRSRGRAAVVRGRRRDGRRA